MVSGLSSGRLGGRDAAGGAESSGAGVALHRRPAGARQTAPLHGGATSDEPAAVVRAGPGAVGLADGRDPPVAAGQHVETEEAGQARVVVAGLVRVVAPAVVDALVGLRVGADGCVLGLADAPGQR